MQALGSTVVRSDSQLSCLTWSCPNVVPLCLVFKALRFSLDLVKGGFLQEL